MTATAANGKVWAGNATHGVQGFHELEHADPGHLDLGGDQAEPPAEPEFEWERIESMMGDQFHLAPTRTTSIPKINADDNVQQMTRKLIRYVAKTQDVDDLDDADIAAIAGVQFDPDAVEPSWLRSNFKIGDDDRIVCGIDASGRPVYLSCRSQAYQTGTFRNRFSNETYTVENLAQKLVKTKFEQGFREAHPEFDDREVHYLFRYLTNPKYAGKKWATLWDESVYSDEVKLAVASAAAPTLLAQNPGMDAAGLRGKIDAMSPDEIRGWLATLPTTTSMSYSGGQRHEQPAYTVTVTKPGLVLRQTLRVSTAEAELNGTTTRARHAALNRAYRAYLEEQLQVEYDFQLNRQYVRETGSGHNATVFEQKKNVPQTHLDAAEQSYFKRSGDFRHVEVDADTDLGKLQQVEREYAQLRRHLPQTGKAPALRFRKTGRHNALGVYHPHMDNIAVDPRHPSSFVHEFIHHVDHTAGGKNLSASDEFRPLLRRAQRAIRDADSPMLNQKLGYYQTPTEVLSRTAELYFHWKQPGTSLNGDDTKYESNHAYVTLAPMRDDIIAFWDRTLADLGADVPR